MSRQVSHSIVVEAAPATVFDLLADPAQHPRFDGSGSVKAALSAPPRLYLGAKFGMRMHLLVPYVISNKVVEYAEDARIGWRHVGRHVWRYELEPVEGKHGPATKVTETFDYAPAPAAFLYERIGIPERNGRSIVATLKRLKALIETPVPSGA